MDEKNENSHELFMKKALHYGRLAGKRGEVPVGAVVVKDGEIISWGYNGRETKKSALAHAEIQAIARANKKLGGWRLHMCDLYVTLEPCPMCAGAIVNARIKRVIIGASDKKAGAFGSVLDMNTFPLNHKPEIIRGVMEKESAELLSSFFAELRKKIKNSEKRKGNIMKKAVVFGAGNIGRGLAGRIFSEAGYEVVFVEVNKEVNDRMNSDRSYPLYVAQNGVYDKRVIENVRAIDGRDMELICKETDECDIAATAVGVNVLPIISRSIAAVIKHRFETKNEKPLNFVLCENKIDVHLFVWELLGGLLSEDEMAYARKMIGLCQSSIGCMVPAPSKELTAQNPLTIVVENYNKIYTDKSGAVGELPAIAALIPYEPFSYYIQRKLFMHNMSHCVCAYHGFKKGYKYIWEAIADKEIRKIVADALNESGKALAKAYNTDIDELSEHGEDLMERYGNELLGDTIARVGADPKRKLSPVDRLTGAALFCLENGVEPKSIVSAIVLGFEFAPADALPNDTCAEVTAYVKENGFEEAVVKYCGIEKGSKLYDMIIAAKG